MSGATPITTKSARLKKIQITALVLLVCSGLINYLDRSTLSIANSAVRAEMGLSAAQMGLLLSAFSLPYAFAQLPMGALLDRMGARFTLGFGMLLWSVAQMAGGFVRTVNQFFVARLLLGVGEAPQFPAGAKVFSDWFALKERGRPTGIFVASTTIAPALAPPILTALMFGVGWRGMFIVEPAKLRLRLDEVRRDGFAMDDREIRPDMSCLAVPILHPQGRTIAAISATERAEDMTPERIETIRLALQQAAGEISARVFPAEPSFRPTTAPHRVPSRRKPARAAALIARGDEL